MCFCSLPVKEHKSAVVQVEGYHRPAVADQLPPRLQVVRQTYNQQHRLLVGTVEHGGQPPVVAVAAQRQHRELSVFAKRSTVASGVQVVAVVIGRHHRRLPPVGQSQAEAPHLTAKPVVVAAQTGILVVGPVLVDDVARQPVVGGRLYAEAAAVAYAAEPDGQLTEPVHGQTLFN